MPFPTGIPGIPGRRAASIAAACVLLYVGAARAESLSLDNAVTAALRGNPSLTDLRARAEALTHMPDQAGSWPDPMLTLGAVALPTDTFDTDQEAMTQLQIGVSQTIPISGRTGPARRAAEAEARAASRETDEARLTLARDVRRTWWNLFYLDHALRVNRENQERLRLLVDAARQRYATGQTGQHEPLQGQMEFTQLKEQEMRLQDNRRQAVITLNVLLDRPADAKVAIPDAALPAWPQQPEAADLLAAMERNRPLIAAMRERVEAAGERAEQARLEYFPDLTLGATYGYRQDTPAGQERADLLSVVASMRVPIFAGSKQNQAIAQKSRETEARRAALDNARLQARGQILKALSEHRLARERAELLKQALIPQARQMTETLQAAYASGKGEFTPLLKAWIGLNNQQLNYWQAVSQGWTALADLTAAVGGETIHEE